MKINILDLIDFKKIDTLLEGFKKSTGFVTAIIDLNGKVLSKSGWMQICTEYHCIKPETSKKCTISYTELAEILAQGEKYHFYKCLNGLVDVAVPIVINGEHIANLFSCQFFFEEPDISFFKKQAKKYGFDEEKYITALKNVPVVSKEKVKTAMDLLLNMTKLISETTLQKLDPKELNKNIRKKEELFTKAFRSSPIAITITDRSSGKYIEVNKSWCSIYGYTAEEAIGHTPAELGIIDSETRRKIIDDLKTKGSLTNVELLLRNKTGEYRTILFSSENIELGDEPCVLSTGIDITDRKRAEEKFKSVFESANVGKSITLPTGEINVNETFCNMLGYTSEELQNKKWQDITPEDEIPTVQECLEPMLKGKKDSVRFEKRYICKNGSHIWADVSVSIRRDDHNKPLYFITTSIDITERKHLEEEQRISAELFSNAFHVGPAGMTITRIADGKFLDTNESFCKLFEFNRDEVIGHTSTELNLWTPEERNKLIQQQIMSGGLHNFEILARSKTGRLINILFSSKQMELKGEACHITTMIDITELKQAETVLQESEERFRTIVEGSPDPIFIQTEKKFAYLNPAAIRLFGAEKPEDLLGKPVMDRFHPAYHDVIKERIRQLNEDRKPVRKQLEVKYIKLDGSEVWVETAGEPIVYKEKNGALVFARDITERKHAVDALKISSERLLFATEGANLGIWNWNTVTGELIWSNQCKALFGIGLDETMSYQRFSNALHPDDRERTDMVVKDALDNHKEYEIEYRSLWPDGSIHWLAAKGRGYYDETGNAVRMEGVVLDITERKQIEIERQKFFLLAESSSDFIGMCDLDMNPLYVNPAGQRMVGLPDVAAACRVKVQDYYFPEDQRFIAVEFFPRVLREGHGDVEIRLRHFQTGEAIWMFYYLFSVHDDSGTPIGWATVSRDITEKRACGVGVTEERTGIPQFS